MRDPAAPSLDRWPACRHAGQGGDRSAGHGKVDHRLEHRELGKHCLEHVEGTPAGGVWLADPAAGLGLLG
jgi:hypothetical protein